MAVSPAEPINVTEEVLNAVWRERGEIKQGRNIKQITEFLKKPGCHDVKYAIILRVTKLVFLLARVNHHARKNYVAYLKGRNEDKDV